MVDVKGLREVLGQICISASHMETLLMSIEGASGEMSVMCEDFLFDEIKHIQVLVLELTKRATNEQSEPVQPVEEVAAPVQAADSGDSAFMPGELNSVQGEVKPVEREV